MSIFKRLGDAVRAFRAPADARAFRSYPIAQNYMGGLFGRNADLVNTKTGMALAQWVNVSAYRAVHARATAIGGLSWVLKSRDTGEVVVRSDDHDLASPFARAIARESEELGTSFFAMWQMAKCVTGEAYFQLVRNDAGFAKAINYLNPMLTEPIAPLGRIEGFRYQGEGTVLTLDVDDVVYDRYRSVYDDVRGLSPLSVALSAINVERNAVRFFEAFFRNNASLGKIVSPKDELGVVDFERFKGEFREQLVGVDNAFKSLISSQPIDLLTVPAPDMDKPLPLLDYIQRQILVAFGVMRTVAGDTDGSRYQASPQDLNWFYLNTVIPEARLMANVVNAQFLPFFYGRRLPVIFEFDLSEWSAVSEGERRRTEQAVTLLQAGVITLNEARRMMGYDDIEGADVTMTPTADVAPVQVDDIADIAEAQGESVQAEAEADAEADEGGDGAQKLAAKLAELRAWQAYHKRGKARPFRVTALDAQEASVVRALLPSVRAFAVGRDLVEGKAFDGISERMRNRLVRAWRENADSEALFVAAFTDILREFGTLAYVAGLRRVGSQRELTEGDKGRIAGWVNAQADYIAGVYNAIVSGELQPDGYAARAELWANAGLSEVYQLGMKNAATDENPFMIPLLLLARDNPTQPIEQTVTIGSERYRVTVANGEVTYNGKRVGRVMGDSIKIDDDALVYEWQLGVAEHCSTCLTLNGQRHTMSEWVASGWLPQSPDLECKGYNCKCSLVPMLGATKRGNFAPAPRRAWGGVHVTLPDDEPTVVKAARYDHIDFTPTDGMVEEAERGLAWRAEYGRGGTEVGVARARDIANRRTLSPDTVRRMVSYFARHEIDKQGAGWSPGEDGYPSAGRIAWALWGGDAGQSWANARLAQMEAADDEDEEG